MHVTFIGHTARLSGGELALANLVPALREIEASAVLAEDGPLVSRLREVGVRVEVLPMKEQTRRFKGRHLRGSSSALLAGPGAAAYAAKLAAKLRILAPDVVHTYSLKAALYGGLAARIAGHPVVWSIQDRIASDFLPSAAIRLVQAASRLLPDLVIANSAATAETLKGARGGVVIVHPPVPPVKSAQSRPEGRPFTAGMVGRIDWWKGHEVFLDAFADAFPSPGVERARIVGAPMFGEDDLLARLRLRAAQLGVADRVDFVGFTSDVSAELTRVDVLVHCSTVPEPFGQVVVEGMAAGLPVVAAAAGGPLEIITPGVDGLLTAPGNFLELAEALRRLAADPELRNRLGAAGLRRADAFRPEIAAAGVRDVYSRIVRPIRPRNLRRASIFT